MLSSPITMVKYSSGSRRLMLLAKIVRLTTISMMDSYIFEFLLSKINVNLFLTSGPIILIINLIPLYVKKCVHYRSSDKTEEGPRMLSLYRFLVCAGTRALIKHGEIGEDSKAAPQKVV